MTLATLNLTQTNPSIVDPTTIQSSFGKMEVKFINCNSGLLLPLVFPSQQPTTFTSENA